jgi:hypothetical protein
MSTSFGGSFDSCLGGVGACSTGFSFGSVMVSGRRCTLATVGREGLGGGEDFEALDACCGLGVGVGLTDGDGVGGSHTMALSLPDLAGAFFCMSGWMNQTSTSSRCSRMVAIRPARFGPLRP